jgi:hypothetical protein
MIPAQAMFSYYAYGLGIHSTLPLPEFLAAPVGDDVSVRVQRNGHPALGASGPQWRFRVTPEEAILPFKDVGVFVVRGGREIHVMPAPGADDDLIRLYIVGTIMAALLYQRGLLVLHASAVEVKGGVIAFLGASGWGKSSIAAALYARGHGLVADDVAAVDLSKATSTVIPALPQIKLNPEVASSLGYERESLCLLHPLEEKRGLRLTHGFAHRPLPLRRVYVLAKDTAYAIEPIRPSEAMVELVRHSYPTRLLQPGGPSHFRQCARLVKDIPIYRLKRSSAIAALPDLAQLVEEHLARAR